MTWGIEFRNDRGVRIISSETDSMILRDQAGESPRVAIGANNVGQYRVQYAAGLFPVFQITSAMTSLQGYYRDDDGMRSVQPSLLNIGFTGTPPASLPLRHIGPSSDIPPSSEGWGLRLYRGDGSPVWDSGMPIVRFRGARRLIHGDTATIANGQWVGMPQWYDEYFQDPFGGWHGLTGRLDRSGDIWTAAHTVQGGSGTGTGLEAGVIVVFNISI